MTFTNAREAQAFFDSLVEAGWLPPPTSEGKVKLGELAETCPTCGGNGLEHILVAGPLGEPDYYECVRNVLEKTAYHGDDVATAAMAYIERLEAQVKDKGSMSYDNEPQLRVLPEVDVEPEPDYGTLVQGQPHFDPAGGIDGMPPR